METINLSRCDYDLLERIVVAFEKIANNLGPGKMEVSHRSSGCGCLDGMVNDGSGGFYWCHCQEGQRGKLKAGG